MEKSHALLRTHSQTTVYTLTILLIVGVEVHYITYSYMTVLGGTIVHMHSFNIIYPYG